jgi:sugar lactone lactonase YvrE
MEPEGSMFTRCRRTFAVIATRIAGIAWVGVVVAGCLSQTTTTCADGTTCSGGLVCAPMGGACVQPAQITVCRDILEGAGCAAPGVDDGTCLARVCSSTTWSPEVVVGNQQNATDAALFQPAGAAFGPDGSLYISVQNVIQRVDRAGVITIIAGTGDPGDAGDSGEATSAQLRSPSGLAVDGHGQVFVADTGNHRLRRIDAAGTITTVAGSGVEGYDGDKGAATLAKLSAPQGVSVDGAGNLAIADTANHRIRCVSASGLIMTCAGTGTAGFNGDLPQAINAQLNSPTSVAVDRNGNLFIADSGNHRVRKVGSNGSITTVAGVGSAGALGDGGPAATAQLSNPTGVALEGDDLLIADSGNRCIRRVARGTITRAAGGGDGLAPDRDGGDAMAAVLSMQLGVAAAPAGGFVVVDSYGLRVRKVNTTGTIATIAGNGTAAVTGGGGAATNIQILFRSSLTTNPRGGFTFTNFPTFTYEVDGAGFASAIAGGAPYGYRGDGGLAKVAGFNNPISAGYDREGNLYISDLSNRRIRRVDTQGVVTTVAGNGTNGDAGDGGDAKAAQLTGTWDLAIDSVGNLYLAEFSSSRIRRVDRSGHITTFVGTTDGFSGDGGSARSAQLSGPLSVAVDSDDTLYICDTNNQRIRRVKDGKIDTVAGGGTGPDGSAATSAQLQYPHGVAIGPDHSLYIAESATARVRRVRDGIITTVAGTGEFGFRGDGGPANEALMFSPDDVAVDRAGRLLISEGGRIRRVDQSGIITTVAGAIDPGAMGARAVARLADPRAITSGPEMTLFAGGASGTVQALIGDMVSVVGGRYPQQAATGQRARFRQATFGAVGGVAYDPVAGQIFVSETTAHRIWIITVVDPADPTTWKISPFANLAGIGGFGNGRVGVARFLNPTGLFLDVAARQLYVADTGGHLVRAIDLSRGLASAAVRTVAGTPRTAGFGGDGGAAGAALLFSPSAVTRCANGDVFVADTGNHRVRRIASGTISTVLGDGTTSSSGAGAPAVTFPVASPRGMGCDAVGNVFATSTNTVRMLQADAAGVVDGTGAVRTIYGLPPRDAFPMSATRCLSGLEVTALGKVRVIDACTGVMVELQRKARPANSGAVR